MKSNSPTFIPIAAAIINDTTMPPALFRSFLRLYAAAQKHSFQHTDPLDFETELVPLLGLRRTQVRQHLRLLRFAKLLDWQTDGSNHYTIRFLVPLPHKSEKTDSVDVIGFNSEDITKNTTEQQTHVAEAALHGSLPEPQSETYRTALHYLLEAGVWMDVARQIARQIAESEAHGEAHALTPADVLGWIAYCFADQEANRIQNPVTVLVANLKADRRCPPAYRPQPVCLRCEYTASECVCPQGPQKGYPDSFLELALGRRRYSPYKDDRWGVCQFCHAYVCKCYDDPEPEAEGTALADAVPPQREHDDDAAIAEAATSEKAADSPPGLENPRSTGKMQFIRSSYPGGGR